MTVPCEGLGAMGTKDRVGVVTPAPVRVEVDVPEVKSALLAVEPGEHSRSCNDDRGESPRKRGENGYYIIICFSM